jgi:hypothetical protein
VSGLRTSHSERAASRRPKSASRCGGLLAVLVLALLVTASSASASAHWHLTARPAPTNLPPGGVGFVNVLVGELGSKEVSAATTPITIRDELPPGITATSIEALQGRALGEFEQAWTCTGQGTGEVACTYNASLIANPLERFTIAPYDGLELKIRVQVNAPPGRYKNVVTVQGGQEAEETETESKEKVVKEEGAVPGQQAESEFTVSGEPTPFGVEEGGISVTPEDENGNLDKTAGAHPYQLTTRFQLNETLEEALQTGRPLLPSSPRLVKDLHFNLPPGLLGNVTAAPTCSSAEFGAVGGAVANINQCKENTAIGVARVTINEPKIFGLVTLAVPVFNLETQRGEPARFGFVAEHAPVLLQTHVRSGDVADSPGGGDFGVEVTVHSTTQLANVLGSEVTLWGNPGAQVHDKSRGWACVSHGRLVEGALPCGPPEARAGAFLISPTSCASPLTTSVNGVSWPYKKSEENGLGVASSLAASFQFPGGFEGCGALPFEPSIKLKANQTGSSTPTGLEVDVHVPQQSTLEPEGRAESAVKSTTVKLPEGVQLSPSAADGLQACSEEQIGYQGEGKVDPYSPAPEPLRFSPTVTAADGSQVLTNCPDASKVGTVKVKTPLLKNELHGSVYLAAQNANPFGSLVALYVAVEDPESGVQVKLAGEVKLNTATGQITSTFLNTPYVPFEDFVVKFNDGPRASVSTPPSCGSYTTGAAFVPWSTGVEQSVSSAPGELDITSGPGGGACPNPQPFGPGFAAWASNTQAGAFTPFSVTIERPDSNQALKTVSVTLPPGAAAMLSSTTPCPEPQASNGTCGPESQIGKATAVSGYGSDPFTVTGGRVYITGPYHGAPFGLSIVTPADAGPFHLGNVIVRSTINVDKSTAAVTIGSTLPTFVSTAEHPDTGIPLQLKRINVVVDRPNFEFNPTNCTPMSVTGALGGAGGGAAQVSSPFKAENCSALPFHPTLTASSQGNASKLNGASLTVKIVSTPGQANIAKTRLVLPIALPSRLTTIQKACLAAVFEANPAACAEGSNIGTATVHTPALKSPLTGPAYLVSHGNAAFPDVEFVLQGEGITLILDGQTDIKKGITTSTFNAVPDAPVTTFETTLPEGPHSALTSNVPESKHFSLCGTKLVIPTTITGQNGVVIQQETKVPVAGCKAVLSFKVNKLQKALKACRKKFKHSKAKRAKCEKQAHKKYGAKKKSKSKKKHAKH